LPAVPELALIATPAPTIAPIMAQCGQRGIRHAVVLSAVSAKWAQRAPHWSRRDQRSEAIRHPLHRPQLPGHPAAAIGLNATFSQGAT